MSLWEVSEELTSPFRIFLTGDDGRRPVNGAGEISERPALEGSGAFSMSTFTATTAPGWANHQTGWTGLVAKLLQQSGVGVHQARFSGWSSGAEGASLVQQGLLNFRNKSNVRRHYSM